MMSMVVTGKRIGSSRVDGTASLRGKACSYGARPGLSFWIYMYSWTA